MSPVDIIDVFKNIGYVTWDHTYCIVESFLIEILRCSALNFPLSWRRCRTFNDHRYQVMPITNAASDISDMAQQSRPICQDHVYKRRRSIFCKTRSLFYEAAQVGTLILVKSLSVAYYSRAYYRRQVAGSQVVDRGAATQAVDQVTLRWWIVWRRLRRWIK